MQMNRAGMFAVCLMAVLCAQNLLVGVNSAFAQTSNEWEESTDPTQGFDFNEDPDIQRSDQPITDENPQDFNDNAVTEVDPESGDVISPGANDENFVGNPNESREEDPNKVYKDGFERDENGAIIAKPGTVIDPKTGDPVTETEEDTIIENRIAVFSGLDKITGNIITFDVYIDETVQFGVLQVTPRVCHTRPPTQTPKTIAFLEVDEQTLDRKIRRIFTGWMFADSPGLNAIEHPVYDIWLKDCKNDSQVPAPDGTISTTATSPDGSQTAMLDENGEELPPVPELASIPVPERPPREGLEGGSQ